MSNKYIDIKPYVKNENDYELSSPSNFGRGCWAESVGGKHPASLKRQVPLHSRDRATARSLAHDSF